jgi:ADP-heptose:LPS heptosyltransferase
LIDAGLNARGTLVAIPRILIIRGGAIGDFVLTLPAIRLIRESIPGSHLEILGYPSIIELAKAGGLAEGTRSLEHGSMARLFAPGTKIDEELVSYLKGFNLIVSYLYDPDGFFRGNMERIGVKTFLEVPHQVQPGKGHAAEQLAKPLEKLAMFLDNPAPRLTFPISESCSERPVVALHPGSGSLTKNWPVANWLRAGRELFGKFPEFRYALITGEAEAERGITAAVTEAWAGQEFLHWDQLPLTELAARLAGGAGFIGHDSGISHLAAACGVPCLLFFGPTDPSVWAPRNPEVGVIVAPGGDLGRLDFETGLQAIRRFAEGLKSARLK